MAHIQNSPCLELWLNPVFELSLFQGYLREGKCHMALGDPSAAIRCYNHVLQIEKNNSQAKSEVC